MIVGVNATARTIAHAIKRCGGVLTIAGGQGLRFSPALVVSEAELDEGVSIVDRVLGALA